MQEVNKLDDEMMMFIISRGNRINETIGCTQRSWYVHSFADDERVL